jgi:hypothetical protein
MEGATVKKTAIVLGLAIFAFIASWHLLHRERAPAPRTQLEGVKSPPPAATPAPADTSRRPTLPVAPVPKEPVLRKI